MSSQQRCVSWCTGMAVKSAKGYGWTRSRVGSFRKTNAIANYAPGERQARGEFTIEEAAKRLGVSYSTVPRMIKQRQLPGRQVCPGAPWIIHAEDVDSLGACGSAGYRRFKAPSSDEPAQQA